MQVGKFFLFVSEYFCNHQVQFFSAFKVVDSRGEIVKVYPHTEHALRYIRKFNIPVSIISSSSEGASVKEFIRLFRWENYFKTIEIFPGKLIAHLKK